VLATRARKAAADASAAPFSLLGAGILTRCVMTDHRGDGDGLRAAPTDREVNRLRRDVRRALRAQGFDVRAGKIRRPDPQDKNALRSLHASSVAHRIARAENGLRRHEPWLVHRLAHGEQLDVAAFHPRLVEVERGSRDELLFRWAALHWSIPVSSGYGRRLRFLVLDEANGKLVGLIGLGDPVFALGARDDWVGWSPVTRTTMLHHVAEAFVLGAVPPYASLLAGKLVAMLAASDEVRRAWRAKYGGRQSLISAQHRDGRLAMLTTTSALGKSSIYNRLRFGDDLVFRSVGETRGSGDFHFSDGLQTAMTEFALEHCNPTAKDDRWGKGFRNRREVVKKVLPLLGYSDQLMYHGIRREVFVAPLATNIKSFLRCEDPKLDEERLPVAWLVDWFVWRWMWRRATTQTLSFSPEQWRLYT
jgi:hypothetical protein